MLPAGSLGTRLCKCEISSVFVKHSQIPVDVSRVPYSHLHSALSLQDTEGTCGHMHGHAHMYTHTRACTWNCSQPSNSCAPMLLQHCRV